jgi:hypothetical protein
MTDTGPAPAAPGGASPEAGWRKLGAPAGLCETCRHAKLNETRKGTAYLRCTRATWDDRLPRYPRLPVSECPGYERPGRDDAGCDSYSPA